MARLTLFNVGIILVVAIGSYAYGFGFGVFITSIGEPGFYVYFNLDRECLFALPFNEKRLPIHAATDPYTATYVLFS
jgi:hypothetical protein